MNYWMRFSHDLKNNADRGGCGCYRPRRIRSYESLVWDQALHRGKKEKKIGVGEKKEPRGSLGRKKSVFLFDPVFCIFSPPRSLVTGNLSIRSSYGGGGRGRRERKA